MVGAFAIAALFLATVLAGVWAAGVDFRGWLHAVCMEAIIQGEMFGTWLRGYL